MNAISPTVTTKCRYRRPLTCCLAPGWRIQPLRDCRRMSPSRQMLKRKQKNVPNSHANAVFPASQRLSSPWCAPVVTRVKRAFGALGKQVFTHFRTQAAPQCTCANEKKSASVSNHVKLWNNCTILCARPLNIASGWADHLKRQAKSVQKGLALASLAR